MERTPDARTAPSAPDFGLATGLSGSIRGDAALRRQHLRTSTSPSPTAHSSHTIKHLLGPNSSTAPPAGAVFEVLTPGWKEPEPITNLPGQLARGAAARSQGAAERSWRPRSPRAPKPRVRGKEPNTQTTMPSAFIFRVCFIFSVYFQGDYQ